MDIALFKDIKNYIIEQLNEANSTIRIAIAWFTNDDLYQTILRLLDKKIHIELIIIDDHINRNEFGLDFNVFISKGGHLFLSTQTKNMHNKFCVIDNNSVITGSYNWTYYAEKRNWENIVATSEKPIINQYIREFDDIKSHLVEVTTYRQYKLKEIDPIALLNEYEYLYEDLYYKDCITGKEYSNYLSTLRTNIIIEKRKDTAIPNSYAAKIVTSHSLGIRCMIDGKADCTSFLIPKGTKIPCEMKRVYLTVADNQISIICETLLGEDLDANKNRSIGKIVLNDIPPLPKGQGKMEVAFKISSDKTLHVIATNLQTRTFVEASYYLSDTI